MAGDSIMCLSASTFRSAAPFCQVGRQTLKDAEVGAVYHTATQQERI